MASSIRHHPVLSYRHVGLARVAPNEKVAQHARQHRAIVLSRNRRDFCLVMRDAAHASTAGDCQAMRCREGGGLVTVDPKLKSFHFDRVTRSLEFAGNAIDWEDVHLLNLRVHILKGQTTLVTLMPRCEQCLQRHSFECERCDELRVVALYEKQFGVTLVPPWI